MKLSKFFSLLVAVLLSSGLITACDSTTQTPTNSSIDGQALSFSFFHSPPNPFPVTNAVLANSCGDPASCHGAGGSQGGALRIFPVDAPTPGQANDTSNYISALAQVVVLNPAVSPLLRKPLAESGGGTKHKGGIIFSDTNDPDYITILAWINNGP